ncbi:tyrosine-type recombinase/integrase [Aurantimicrobium photophilum]|uniref:Prophage phiRv2 integrase n=1 Tax=Aurantimicrobium photophilum TaxID=1987356 RepID=A0A2Z3S4Y4_9MICO|nr:site-specific integrase [Aurantimicrobium photophilum]AWR21322.1 Putative prophage phiRv2 integrase [Aurantimicrobium photophilum]
MNELKSSSKPKLRQKNGTGHTYKFRNGWRCVIQFQGRVITATGPTKSDAQRRAREKMGAIRPLNYGVDRTAGNLKVGPYLLDWLEYEHKSEIAFTTYKRYKGLLTVHVVPLIGQISLAKLEKRHINSMLKAMKASGQSDRSRQQARAVLSKGLSSAIDEDLISVNPVRETKRVVVKKHIIDPLSPEEVSKVFTAAKDTSSLLRWRIALLYGLRQGECLGLRWQDINFENATMNIRVQIQNTESGRDFTDLKTELSRRELFLDEKTLILFAKHRDELDEFRSTVASGWQEHDLIFPNKLGFPMQSSWDSKLWHRALSEAGVSDRRLHDARHTAATLLFEEKTDIEVIRRVLGHSDIGLTSRTYVHASAEPMKRVANTLNGF